MKKRKLEERGEEITRKFFTQPAQTNLTNSLKLCYDEDNMCVEQDNKEDDDDVASKSYFKGKNIAHKIKITNFQYFSLNFRRRYAF